MPKARKPNGWQISWMAA